MGIQRFNWVLCVCCGALAVPRAAAEGPKGANVAVVDLAHIFEKYQMTQDLEAAFDERRRAAAAEAESRRAAVEAKRKELVTRKPESREFAELEEQITRMEIEYEVWAKRQEIGLKQDHKRWLMRIYNHVREAVAQIAMDAGIDLVLTYDQLTEDAPDSIALRQQILLQKIIYFNNRIDLTQVVLARVNENYEKAGGASSLRFSDGRVTDDAVGLRQSGMTAGIPTAGQYSDTSATRTTSASPVITKP